MVNQVLSTAASYFYTVIVAIVILLVGFTLGLLIRKLLHKMLQEIKLNNILAKAGLVFDAQRWLAHIVADAIYLITVVLFLQKLGIQSLVLYLLVLGLLALVSLTVLVGLKDVIPNFRGWLFLRQRRNVKPGQRIVLQEVTGIVKHIGYLETQVSTEQGDILYVPNFLFLRKKI